MASEISGLTTRGENFARYFAQHVAKRALYMRARAREGGGAGIGFAVGPIRARS